MSDVRIIFLHHSTGESIWHGGEPSLTFRIARKLGSTLGWGMQNRGFLPSLLERHNKQCGTKHRIQEQAFPKAKPYGWRNYPFDYYNIWVKNAGPVPFMEEPTLEMLTAKYDIISFKHCFPVSNIKPDKAAADVNEDYRSLANYKLHYLALREKLHQFPSKKFIVWTGAAQVKPRTTEDEAKRAREFFDWVVNEWDLPDDNVYVWDFFQLQTEGELYFQEQFALSPDNSHPNSAFSNISAKLFFQRLIDVVESNGCTTSATGSLRPAEHA